MIGSEVTAATSSTGRCESASDGPRKNGGNSMSASAPASSASRACFVATSRLWAITETMVVCSRDPSVEGGFDQGLPVGIRELVELASQPEHREARKPDRTQMTDEPDDALFVYLATGTEGRRQDRVAATKLYAHALLHDLITFLRGR